MVKLTKTVSKEEEENKKNEQNNNASLSITQKNDKPKQNQDTQETVNQVSKQNIKAVEIKENQEAEGTAQWLFNVLGKEIFNHLKNNEHLQLPYTEEDITSQEWLIKSIKTFFTEEDLKIVGQKISENQKIPVQLKSSLEKIEELKDKLEKSDKKHKQLNEAVDDAEEVAFKIRKQLQATVELKKLIEIFFEPYNNGNEEMERLLEILNDSLADLDNKLSLFITNFARGWAYLQSNFDNLDKDEKVRLEKVHNALSVLLSYISGISTSQRRPLLDTLAKIVSAKFENYDFISPERTLQVDPAIHNADGVGSGMIKEGISFAVIRRESRKAVIYADIVVA